MSSSISITLFVLSINFLVFYSALKTRFTNNEMLNFILKRCLIIFGLFLMTLNSGIMMQIASDGGLTLTKELLRYLWLFGWAGYLAMVFTFLQSIVKFMKLWKIRKYNKKYGENDNE